MRILTYKMLSGEILYLFFLGKISTETCMVFRILDFLCSHSSGYFLGFWPSLSFNKILEQVVKDGSNYGVAT